MKRPHESLYQDLTQTYRPWQVFLTSDHTVPSHEVDVILTQSGRHDFAFDDPLLLHRLLRRGLFVSRFRVQYSFDYEATYVGIRFTPIPWLLLTNLTT